MSLCRDKKRNRTISYVPQARRPRGNNRLVLLYDSINVYVPLNDLLGFGFKIVMLSGSGQVYCESEDDTSTEMDLV